MKESFQDRRKIMIIYQAIRIFANGRATYGDRYKRIFSNTELEHNQIISVGNDRYMILFKEE